MSEGRGPQVNLNTVLIVAGIAASIFSGFRWVNQLTTTGATTAATVNGKLDVLTSSIAELKKAQSDETKARQDAVSKMEERQTNFAAKMEERQDAFVRSWEAWQKLQLYERADLLVALSKAGVKMPQRRQEVP